MVAIAVERLLRFVPSLGAALVLLIALVVVRRLLTGDESLQHARAFVRQVVVASIWVVGMLVVLLALPMHDETRGQIMGLLGILLSGAIALSSTAVLTNAISGLVIRGQGAFKIGDFIRVGEHFGRVTEIGLIQSEIQTEDRNLTTFPNSYLVQNAVTTFRDEGTLVSAEVSLGFDIPQRRVKRILVRAADSCGLQEAFVQVRALGDFSVLYRVVALLDDTRKIITMRSKLREAMLDELHAADIEVVSPNFVNMRHVDETPVIARRVWMPEGWSGETSSPEDVMFDKAKEAETLLKLREVYGEFGDRLAETEAALGKAKRGTDEREELMRRRAKLLAQRDRLKAILEGRSED